MAGDRVQDHVQVPQHLVVPEAEDYPALGSQPVVASSVVVILVVLFAIAFNDHLVGQAGEIDNEPSDDYLPPKVTFQLTPSQSSPKHGLPLLSSFAATRERDAGESGGRVSSDQPCQNQPVICRGLFE